MRVLILTDLYPPHYLGGYEIACQQAADQLRSLGHQVQVLTTTYGVPKAIEENGIARVLATRSSDSRLAARLIDIAKRPFLQRRDKKWLRKYLDSFEPDLIYVWSMKGTLGKTLPLLNESRKPVVYHLEDYWLLEWNSVIQEIKAKIPHVRSDNWKRFISDTLQTILNEFAPVPLNSLDIRNCIFVSQALKDVYCSEFPQLSKVSVIHNSIDIADFPCKHPDLDPEQPRILYVGRVAREKGIHIALYAVAELIRRGISKVSLTIVGCPPPPKYKSDLDRIIEQKGLEKNIRFLETVPREEIVGIYHNHDILVFPSIWGEPFAHVPIEAMASGLAVAGTITGGTGEILIDQETGLVCKTEDPIDLADNIQLLLDSPQTFEAIVSRARRRVEAGFTLDAMGKKIETFLKDIPVETN